ncbi:MAG: N-acetyl-gamma-glutamyl-phosphate reductase [bacterium]|nr:N-acetyl-gamma-glutamyl-phosphate reductase [bacterium]
MPGLRAAVLGAGGYAGGELMRLLLSHPEVEGVRGYSSTHAGEAWGSVHPPLSHLEEGSFEEFDVSSAARGADVIFLALPHGKSQELAPEIERCDPSVVVDLAADFRISDPKLYEQYYGPHMCFESVAGYLYGLADVESYGLRNATRIAAPGCFATATLLGLYPLVKAGLLAKTPVCIGLTGSSGSGAALKPTTHHPRRSNNLYGYCATGHRHEAEIADRLRHWSSTGAQECTLLPHSAPLVRGIHATLSAEMVEPCLDPLALFRDAYAGRPFVKILAQPPQLSAVVATNFAHIHAVVRRGGRELVIYVVIDNLVKGAAGQAVQAMNLALGLEETSGLEFSGVSPC